MVPRSGKLWRSDSGAADLSGYIALQWGREQREGFPSWDLPPPLTSFSGFLNPGQLEGTSRPQPLGP